jgi:DtxR family Mn-dependent transcriptional regulator
MSTDTATVAEEEYLQILFWLQEARLPMTGANIARAMQLSAPTVHEMVGRLERDGYITRGQDRVIAFTADGTPCRRCSRNVCSRRSVTPRHVRTDTRSSPASACRECRWPT